jgi:transposase InsO family protein
MQKRTDEAQRREFFRCHLRGKSYADIATAEGFSKECVRYWCRRQKRGGSVVSHYHGPAPGLLQRFDPLVRFVVLKLRLQHPGWGPAALRLGLQKRPSLAHLSLPSPSQIGRYLHQFKYFRRKKHSVSSRRRPRQPQYTFQRWQMDFKLGIPLLDGSQVNLFTVCDAFAGFCIGARVFPAGQVGQAPKKVVQEQVRMTLRECFTRWNVLPSELQTDGETSLVSNRGPNDFPTSLTRWLIGLGIDHLVIRPGRPTDNSEVERMHRTLNNFALKGMQLTELKAINQALAESVTILVYELPSHAKNCHGRPPIQAYPELEQPRHFFQPAWELAQFDLTRVDRYLAQFSWERRVGKTGQVDIGAQVYSVGRPHARKLVTIRFDPQQREFIFYAQKGVDDLQEQELIRHPIRGCEVADLMGYSTPDLSPGPQQLPLPFDCPFYTKSGYVVKEQIGV